jgi:autophagy-related protein 2
MAFFLPSLFQKKILRYALSRLDLLDTDALDLDRLDIAWGKRSTVELRDVGLQLAVSRALHRGQMGCAGRTADAAKSNSRPSSRFPTV